MDNGSHYFKTALSLIFLLGTSVISYASHGSNINVLDVYFVNAQKAMFQADDFADRKHALMELEKVMFELQKPNSIDSELDQETSFSLDAITTTLELISLAQLEADTCDRELTKIHVAFDPTTEGTPRLPYYVRQIYNLIADTCINGAAKLTGRY